MKFESSRLSHHRRVPHIRTAILAFAALAVMLLSIGSCSAYEVSVKQFGAKGDGATDDRAAIQAAINDVHNHGGGTVNFPSGTYRVTADPARKIAIQIYKNITLQGAVGSGKNAVTSTIKMADNPGKYQIMMAGQPLGDDLSNFQMFNICLDGNYPVIQPDVDSSGQHLILENRHDALVVYNGSKVKISRCNFINMACVNIISLNGLAVKDAEISNCQFLRVGGGTGDYDHSSIYIETVGGVVSDCVFKSLNGPGTVGARTAVEIHGSNQYVRNNYITGFSGGFNICGTSTNGGNNTWYTNNVVEGAYRGFEIWITKRAGDPGMSNCNIVDNKVTFDVDAWRKLLVSSSGPASGIMFGTMETGMRGLNIKNNKFTYTNIAGPGTSRDDKSCAITLYPPMPVTLENVSIENNIITNPLGPGMYFNTQLKSASIKGNTIINPGSTTRAFAPLAYSAMTFGGSTENVMVQANRLVDNRAEKKMTYGVWTNSNVTGTCRFAGDNVISPASVSALFRAGGTGTWLR